MPNFTTQCDMNPLQEPDIEAIESDAGGAGDISMARLKLDDLLNEIADRNETGNHSTDDETAPLHPPPTTATKRIYTHKVSRKKRKKDHTMRFDADGHPRYIIKLFDRELDLAKFEADTTQYVMLRRWMKNRQDESKSSAGDCSTTTQEDKSSSPDGATRDPDHPEYLYELPAPTKSKELYEYPRPLPPALKTAKIEDIINTEDNIEELRRDNMARWRRVKGRWRDHSFRQQKRNSESLRVLKEMFMKQTSKLV